MTGLVTTIKDALRKRSQYNRTVAEIEALSPREAMDLGIYREDAAEIAWNAVYGDPRQRAA